MGGVDIGVVAGNGISTRCPSLDPSSRITAYRLCRTLMNLGRSFWSSGFIVYDKLAPLPNHHLGGWGAMVFNFGRSFQHIFHFKANNKSRPRKTKKDQESTKRTNKFWISHMVQRATCICFENAVAKSALPPHSRNEDFSSRYFLKITVSGNSVEGRLGCRSEWSFLGNAVGSDA